jgi:hypothetical protein
MRTLINKLHTWIRAAKNHVLIFCQQPGRKSSLQRETKQKSFKFELKKKKASSTASTKRKQTVRKLPNTA